MKQFLVIYYAPAEVIGAMEKATPEQKAAGMKPWMDWKTEYEDNIINFGAPLTPGQQISSNKEWTDSTKEVSGFSILQTKDEGELYKILENHPHISDNTDLSIGVYPFIKM